MSAANHDAPRKPSSSASYSRGHSPSGSPNPHRSGSNNMFSIGMGPGPKNLNAGWQVWANPTASRNPSGSSSVTESSLPHSEPGYRSSLADSWNARSGNWDDMSQADLQQQRDLDAHLSLGGRHNASGGQKQGRFSPQRFGQSQLLPSPGAGAGYDTMQSTSTVDSDLSAALRGMAVADDFNASQQTLSSKGRQQERGQPQYATYPPAEFGYYAGASYSYPGADMYAPSPALSAAPTTPGFHPGLAPDPRGQPYYDYTNSPRPAAAHTHYFYPAQTVMYHPAPPHSPMIASHSPNKKRDQQFAQAQAALMYPTMRQSPSPHAQTFAAAMDYTMHIAHGIPQSPLYGHPQGQHARGGGGRHGRRHGDNTIRSALLDEFRANKSRKWELREIYGYVVEFSGDQHGSRFIQQKLEAANADEMQIIFDEIVPNHALQLMQDVFGNYVIQKLLEFGTPTHRQQLLSTMEGHILPLSLQMYGCRVIQRAIEHTTVEQQAVFVQELTTTALQCVKDANGNHVIQKLIEHVAPERLTFIQTFRGSVYELATHPYGCRVLQRCFEHLPSNVTRPLIDELHKHVLHLMQDQFGNYVVQFVLEHGQPQDRAVVVAKLQGQMLSMARHKFASNVCEKALVTAEPESRRQMIEEILTPKQDGIPPLQTMMKDQFANYVLQRALSVADPDQRDAMVAKIKPHLVNLRKYSSAYSKHLSAIERLLEKTERANAQNAPPATAGEEAAPTQTTQELEEA